MVLSGSIKPYFSWYLCIHQNNFFLNLAYLRPLNIFEEHSANVSPGPATGFLKSGKYDQKCLASRSSNFFAHII